MTKIRISAISYTNTKPFIFGINNKPELLEYAEIEYDSPSNAALKLISGEADLGIIPVAALPYVPNLELVSDFCIGADGAVNSVFVFSNMPLESIKTIRLDLQSRTSNNLAKVLEKFYWNKGIEFISPESPEIADAIVQIGDRTFISRSLYAYKYDLAEEWKSFTGLPFVFAVWAANKKLESKFITLFNDAISFGVSHRKEVIDELSPIAGFDLTDYLLNRLSYTFDERKKEGLSLFLSYLKLLDNF